VPDALRTLVDALYLALSASLPLLAVSFVCAASVAVVQVATGLLEPSLNVILRLISASAALFLFGPWMGAELSRFATHIFASLQHLGR
jgi:flagellar biosynthetic protein FliQ